MDESDPRDRYLAAAARIFARRGYHGASLSQVAAELDVTKQALLHFFPKKEALYVATLARLSDRLVAQVRAAGGATGEARLTAFFEAYWDESALRPDDARLVAFALLECEPEAEAWPLKPFLNALIGLAGQTERWSMESPAARLAGLYRLIAASHYFAISTTALSGMYGDGELYKIAAAARTEARRSLAVFLEPEAGD